jgi:hypothetical protein
MPGIQDINRNDLGVMGAGALAFIASFFPYWGYTFGPLSVSINAWHSYALLGLLLVFLAAIVIAIKTFAADSMPSMPVGLHVLAAGLAALGTLLLVIRAFTYPHHNYGSGASYGVKWGAYVLFIFCIAEVVFALLGMRESGEKVAWQTTGTASPPPAAPPTA